jgi:hypothetical protein
MVVPSQANSGTVAAGSVESPERKAKPISPQPHTSRRKDGQYTGGVGGTTTGTHATTASGGNTLPAGAEKVQVVGLYVAPVTRALISDTNATIELYCVPPQVKQAGAGQGLIVAVTGGSGGATTTGGGQQPCIDGMMLPMLLGYAYTVDVSGAPPKTKPLYTARIRTRVGALSTTTGLADVSFTGPE